MSGCAISRPRRVDDEGLALLADLDLRDDVPDELQVHLGDADAGVAARAGHGERHVGLGLAAEIDRAVVDLLRHGFGELGVLGIIGADADRVHGEPRHPQLLLAAGVELGELGDRRHLAQQAQRVEAALLQRARGPRQLRGPADLALDVLDELADLGGGGLGLLALDAGQRLLVLLVGKPDLEQAVGQERHADHGDEQRDVFPEQPAADMRGGAGAEPAQHARAGPGRMPFRWWRDRRSSSESPCGAAPRLFGHFHRDYSPDSQRAGRRHTELIRTNYTTSRWGQRFKRVYPMEDQPLWDNLAGLQGLGGAMNCPYCAEQIKDSAIVCKHCRRDLFVIRPLHGKARRGDQEGRGLRSRLSGGGDRACSGHSAAADAAVLQLPSIEPLAAMAMTFILLVIAHYIIIVEYSLPLIFLRVVSIVVPLAFGFLCRESERIPAGVRIHLRRGGGGAVDPRHVEDRRQARQRAGAAAQSLRMGRIRRIRRQHRVRLLHRRDRPADRDRHDVAADPRRTGRSGCFRRPSPTSWAVRRRRASTSRRSRPSFQRGLRSARRSRRSSPGSVNFSEHGEASHEEDPGRRFCSAGWRSQVLRRRRVCAEVLITADEAKLPASTQCRHHARAA